MALKVSLPDSRGVESGFSISSSPFDEDFVELTCRRGVGHTGQLFTLSVGDIVTLGGPSGDWLYEESPSGAVLIGGGSGIAPLRAMIHYQIHRGRPEDVTLFYSARTPSDIIFRGELERFSKVGVRVHVTITRPEAMKPGESWEGSIGRLDATRILQENPDTRDRLFYLCGPESMISELAAGLAAQGVARERIRYERRETSP